MTVKTLRRLESMQAYHPDHCDCCMCNPQEEIQGFVRCGYCDKVIISEDEIFQGICHECRDVL
jgi:hypothetical protein